jgi:uncharacterized membrane protein (UPF0127 family)
MWKRGLQCWWTAWVFFWLLLGPMPGAQAAWGADAAEQGGGGHRPRTTAIFDQMALVTIKLMDDAGGVIPVEARIAVRSEEHQAGFQYISPEVIEKSLILFVFPETRSTRFHMRNVEAPLDIAFIDSEGSILDLQEMDPDPGSGGSGLRTYGPNKPFRYALEAHAGFFKEHHISAGSGWLVLR